MIRLSFLLISIVLSSSALGQPMIDSVSGEFSEGNIVSIFGARFGENPVAADSGGENQDGEAAIGSTQASVFISNTPNWSEAEDSLKEIQNPVYWVPNQIDIQVNTGSFHTGDDAYLFIVDAEGRVNSGGYQVDINAPHEPDSTGAPGVPGTPQIVQ